MQQESHNESEASKVGLMAHRVQTCTINLMIYRMFHVLDATIFLPCFNCQFMQTNPYRRIIGLDKLIPRNFACIYCVILSSLLGFFLYDIYRL